MQSLIRLFFRSIEHVLVLFLAAMVIMVFGNVVLRYGFNSGIISSEELSRFLFIWITFLGAILALREGAHLGIDTLVRILPRAGTRACFAISELLQLVCCGFMFYGTWLQHPINATNISAVTEIPMIWVYGVGYLASLAMGAIIIVRLFRFATGQLSDAELIQVHDSEEEARDYLGDGARK